MMSAYSVVALVSGGKDSCYSMMQTVAAGHKIVALANLRPVDMDIEELDSHMFQTVGHSGLNLYAEAMGVPLFRGSLTRSSVARQRDYVPQEDDEVEDLKDLLEHIRAEGVSFTAVCSGAILSDYQRVRVENVCSRLGLVSLSYLWRRDQSELLNEMVEAGIHAVLIKVATLGLEAKHLGKSLKEMQSHLEAMNGKYGINVCGEGGEFESFTLNCPLFRKAIKFVGLETVIDSDNPYAPVAYLKLNKLSLEDKKIDPSISQLELLQRHSVASIRTPDSFVSKFKQEDLSPVTDCSSQVQEKLKQQQVPSVSQVDVPGSGSLLYVSGLGGRGESAMDEGECTKKVFKELEAILTSHSFPFHSLVSVSLSVRTMEAYSRINAAYVGHFSRNPPSRLCVEADLDENMPLRLDAVAWKGATPDQDPPSRTCMHVQSVSHWAPANIGPYSQAVETNNGFLFLAGQIGLIPGSMALIKGMEAQARLGLRHVRRVLRVYGLNLRHIGQMTCYTIDPSFNSTLQNLWHEHVHEDSSEEDYSKLCPLNFICVPGLPRGALVEWHPAMVSKEAADCSFVTLSGDSKVLHCLTRADPSLGSEIIKMKVNGFLNQSHVDAVKIFFKNHNWARGSIQLIYHCPAEEGSLVQALGDHLAGLGLAVSLVSTRQLGPIKLEGSVWKKGRVEV